MEFEEKSKKREEKLRADREERIRLEVERDFEREKKIQAEIKAKEELRKNSSRPSSGTPRTSRRHLQSEGETSSVIPDKYVSKARVNKIIYKYEKFYKTNNNN